MLLPMACKILFCLTSPTSTAHYLLQALGHYTTSALVPPFHMLMLQGCCFCLEYLCPLLMVIFSPLALPYLFSTLLSHLVSREARRLISIDYILSDSWPSLFLLGQASGKHWQENGGQEEQEVEIFLLTLPLTSATEELLATVLTRFQQQLPPLSLQSLGWEQLIPLPVPRCSSIP